MVMDQSPPRKTLPSPTEPVSIVVTQNPCAISIRLERAVRTPIHEHIQADGQIRRWALIPEMENRYLRVVLLPDGETVHNVFFDRRFQP